MVRPFQAGCRGLSCCIWGRGAGGPAGAEAPLAQRGLRLSRDAGGARAGLVCCVAPGRSQRPRGAAGGRGHDTSALFWSRANENARRAITLHEPLGFLLTRVSRSSRGLVFGSRPSTRLAGWRSRGRADEGDRDGARNATNPCAARVCFWPCRPRLLRGTTKQRPGCPQLAWCERGGDAEAKRTLRFGASAVVGGGGGARARIRFRAPRSSAAYVTRSLDSPACGVRFLVQVLTGGPLAVGLDAIVSGVVANLEQKLQLRLQ
jgi:hypothetical protein